MFTARALGLVVLLAVAAVVVRVITRPLGDAVSGAFAGALAIGGPLAVVVSQEGRWRRRPVLVLAFVLGAAAFGAGFGTWMYR